MDLNPNRSGSGRTKRRVGAIGVNQYLKRAIFKGLNGHY